MVDSKCPSFLCSCSKRIARGRWIARWRVAGGKGIGDRLVEHLLASKSRIAVVYRTVFRISRVNLNHAGFRTHRQLSPLIASLIANPANGAHSQGGSKANHPCLVRVAASPTPATSSLRMQIENSAHGLDNFWELIPCRSAQQHCHRRVEDLFYDVAT
jgi:hypothetical protein